MVTKNKTINGKTLEIRYYEVDFSDCFNDSIINPSYYTSYDNTKDCAIVSINSPEWYKELASLAEMIMSGHHYEEIVPNISQNDEDHRRALVDKYVSDIAGEKKLAFRVFRTTLYRALIGSNYCRAEEINSMRCAYNSLIGNS